MFGNYFKVALRNLLRNRLYALINIVGLAIGLGVYLMSGLITDYERNHDRMFENRDRIYTVASVFNPATNQGSHESRAVYTGLRPQIEAQMPELVASSRALGFEGLLRAGEKSFYENVKYVDPDFLKIFDFEFIHGSADSLIGPGQVIVTDLVAERYFGRLDVVGETITLKASDADHPLDIVGVIRDVGKASHFNSALDEERSLSIFGLIGTPGADYEQIDVDTNWGWLNSDFMTYLLTDGQMDVSELNDRVNAIYDNSHESRHDDSVLDVAVRSLDKENLSIWYAVGMPVMETIDILGVLILLIAVLNYTNLATVQNIRRFREVGLRKTLGASRKQLLGQFLVECQLVVALSMVLSLALVELAVPAFNTALGKSLVIDYGALLPWLIATTVGVGLLAGLYPALVITRTTPSEAIRNLMHTGRSGALFRNVMIGTQFVISIILLAMVMVVYQQNSRVQEASEIFPKSEVMVINRVNNDVIWSRADVLEREIGALPDVEYISWATQVPFVDQSWQTYVTKIKGDMSSRLEVNHMMATHDFLKTFDIPILAGRHFDRDNLSDNAATTPRESNVVINETLARMMGHENPSDAVGDFIFRGVENPFSMTVIGVMEDRNILGLQNQVMPFFIRVREGYYSRLSIRLRAGTSMDTIAKIEDIWQQINPEFPIDWGFLDATFEERFQIMRSINTILVGFSVLAIMLALIGLFGLSAYMARSRTREIGIRKVLGATIVQIVRLLTWQFSRPVMWAIVLAVPLAWMAADVYLQYFADRISTQAPIILVAGLAAVMLAWGVIAGHAIRVARANPITALRYE